MLLLVKRTGGGKTHITRVVGAAEKGITIIVINLYTLSANQMVKFVGANQEYGMVEAPTVDALFDQSKQQYHELLQRANGLPRDTISTIFIFSLPQLLCNHPEFVQMLDNKALEAVLRVVVLDEIHLHVQQGTSFRKEIHELRPIFFDRIFDKRRGKLHQKIIFATGTLYR